MAGEGGIGLVDVGVVETGTDDSRLEIIVTNGSGNPTKITEGIFVQSEKGLATYKSYQEIAKGGIVRDKN